MIKLKSKAISCILVFSTAFTTFAPIHANAENLKFASNSNFEYELSAEIVTEKNNNGEFNDLVKLTFNVINNPGSYQIKFAFKLDCKDCDKVNYNIVKYGVSEELINNQYYILPTLNREKNFCMVDILTNFTNDPTSWPYDRNDCYSYSLYLDIDDSKLYDYEFSSIVLTYKSLTENIDVDIPTSEGILNNEFSLNATDTDVPYIVGDVVRDNIINISDATETFKIASCAEQDTTVASVNNINKLINAGVSTETVNWAHEFPGLILNSKYACAEVADVDNNHIINQYDGIAILQYYSNHVAGLDVDKYINSEQFKTITMFQSTSI